MSIYELSPEALRVIEKVKKLLALAADERGNEHQAASAAAKAHELLEIYNLDMAVVGHTAKGSQRSDAKLKGGLYKWQRDLWESVARLNFCMYWSIRGVSKGSTYQHRVLGRQENVIGAEVLADYLQGAVDRITKDVAKERGLNVFCREMIAHREGMAARLCERLESRRREKLQEERRRQQEQETTPAPSGDTRNALVLASLIESEDDLNNDFRHGWEPGTTARRRQEWEARYQALTIRQERERQERKQWEADHPEEAARLRAQQQKERDAEARREERNRRRRKGYQYKERKMTAEEARRCLPEFDEGYEAADTVSLHQQVTEAKERPSVGEGA